MSPVVEIIKALALEIQCVLSCFCIVCLKIEGGSGLKPKIIGMVYGPTALGPNCDKSLTAFSNESIPPNAEPITTPTLVGSTDLSAIYGSQSSLFGRWLMKLVKIHK